MAFDPTFTLNAGSAVGPMLAYADTQLILAPVTITFGSSDTYVTGGYSIVLPDGLEHHKLVDILSSLPRSGSGARDWRWNGDPADPKLLAYDAFNTQEGNGQSIADEVIRLVLMLR